MSWQLAEKALWQLAAGSLNSKRRGSWQRLDAARSTVSGTTKMHLPGPFFRLSSPPRATHQPPAAAYMIQAHTSFLVSSLQSTPTSPSQHQLSSKATSKISSHALCIVHDSTSQPRPSHTRHVPILISDRHSPSHPGSETRPKTLLCIAGLPKSPRLLPNPTPSTINEPSKLFMQTGFRFPSWMFEGKKSK